MNAEGSSGIAREEESSNLTLRQIALDMAIRATAGLSAPGMVVEAAGKFEAYLRGGIDASQGKD